MASARYNNEPFLEYIQHRDEKIVQFIRSYREKNGISPTYSEMAIHLGWGDRGKGNVKRHVDKLIVAGKLRKLEVVGRNGQRGIVPVEQKESIK